MSNLVTDRGDGLFYERVGQGPPLVLLPGVMGSGLRFHSAGYVERLSDSFTLLLIDPLGHHRSDKPLDPAAYKLDECLGHVLAVLDAEGFAQAHVLGFSRGAIMAVALGSVHPDRVLSVTAIGWPSGDGAQGVLDTLKASEEVLAAGDWDRYFDMFPVPIPDEVREMIVDWNDPAAIGAVNQAVFDVPGDWLRTAADLRVPALVIIGGEEPFVDSTVADAEQAGVSVVVIDGADHSGSFFAVDQVLGVAVPHIETHPG